MDHNLVSIQSPRKREALKLGQRHSNGLHVSVIYNGRKTMDPILNDSFKNEGYLWICIYCIY